jgi:hypothetical protein
MTLFPFVIGSLTQKKIPPAAKHLPGLGMLRVHLARGIKQENGINECSCVWARRSLSVRDLEEGKYAMGKRLRRTAERPCQTHLDAEPLGHPPRIDPQRRAGPETDCFRRADESPAAGWRGRV